MASGLYDEIPRYEDYKLLSFSHAVYERLLEIYAGLVVEKGREKGMRPMEDFEAILETINEDYLLLTLENEWAPEVPVTDFLTQDQISLELMREPCDWSLHPVYVASMNMAQQFLMRMLKSCAKYFEAEMDALVRKSCYGCEYDRGSQTDHPCLTTTKEGRIAQFLGPVMKKADDEKLMCSFLNDLHESGFLNNISPKILRWYACKQMIFF